MLVNVGLSVCGQRSMTNGRDQRNHVTLMSPSIGVAYDMYNKRFAASRFYHVPER